jgi:transcriptional regulator with XRE-family HTH domain
MDVTTQKIANRLKEVRIQKDLTQADVARKAAINSNTYAKIERGEQAATVKMLERIADALGIELSEVFTFKTQG